MPPFLSTRVEPRLLKWIRRDRESATGDRPTSKKAFFAPANYVYSLGSHLSIATDGAAVAGTWQSQVTSIYFSGSLPFVVVILVLPWGDGRPQSCFLPLRRRRKVITIIRATCGVMTSLESDGLHLPDPLVRSQATQPFVRVRNVNADDATTFRSEFHPTSRRSH